MHIRTHPGSMVAEMMERDGVRFLQQTSHKSFRVRDENKPVLPEGARKVSEHTYAHASPGDHDSLDGDDVLYQLPFGKSDDGEFVYHQLNRKKLRMEKYQHPSGVIETRTYFTTNMNIANLNAGADSGVGDGDGERSNGEYSSTYKVPAGPIIAKYAAEDGREVEEEFDTVLMAIGRAACVEGLGLDHPSVNVQLSNNKVGKLSLLLILSFPTLCDTFLRLGIFCTRVIIDHLFNHLILLRAGFGG